MSQAKRVKAEHLSEPTLVIDSAEGGGAVDPIAWAEFVELVKERKSDDRSDFSVLADKFSNGGP